MFCCEAVESSTEFSANAWPNFYFLFLPPSVARAHDPCAETCLTKLLSKLISPSEQIPGACSMQKAEIDSFGLHLSLSAAWHDNLLITQKISILLDFCLSILKLNPFKSIRSQSRQKTPCCIQRYFSTFLQLSKDMEKKL